MAHDVGEDIHRQGQILVDDLGVIIRAQLAGGGVELPADAVHFLGDLPGGALARALEGHMFHKMGKAVFPGGFQHAPRLHPRPDGYGAQGRHFLHQHGQPIVQDKFLHCLLLD